MRTVAMNPGSLEPVSISDIKNYARVMSQGLEDSLIQGLIVAARRQCEEFARMSISPREWETAYRIPQYVSLGMGLGGGWNDPENVVKGFRLPRHPILSLDALSWATYDGDVAAEGYIYDRHTQKVHWVEPFHKAPEGSLSLVARYTAGFAAIEGDNAEGLCDAPEEIKTAVMVVATSLYENRASEKPTTMPRQAQELLRGWWSSASVE